MLVYQRVLDDLGGYPFFFWNTFAGDDCGLNHIENDENPVGNDGKNKGCTRQNMVGES